MFSKKKRKKRSSFEIKLRFLYFPSKFQVFSKKKKMVSNSVLSIFVPKFKCCLKKKVFTQNQALNCLFLTQILCFVDYMYNNRLRLDITRLNFSKCFVTLLGFSKFRGTKHKTPICFATPKIFYATLSLRNPGLIQQDGIFIDIIDLFQFLSNELLYTSILYITSKNLQLHEIIV